jgi:acetolactate synthase-1/2/3 large subunit
VGDRLQLTAAADVPGALRGLCGAAAAPFGPNAWLDEVLQALAWRPPAWARASSSMPGRLHPVQALQPLQALLSSHPRSVLVCDGGEFGQWAQAVLHAPRRLINGVAGAIGSALPYAVAARLGEPEAPVVAVMGDGTFGFHMAEIDTAVRCGAPFVALIGNDARWNAEHQIQLREYGPGRLIGCELLPTRYDLVCSGLGGHGEWVTEAAQLPPALHRAQASGKPACVNVMIEGLAAPAQRRGA